MRLLLDMGLPRRAVDDLRLRGLQVEHVGELGLSTATDSEILARAEATRAVVITLDADFARLLALSSASNPSVIHIRVSRVTRQKLLGLLLELLPTIDQQLDAGSIVSVDENGARVRPLPIRG